MRFAIVFVAVGCAGEASAPPAAPASEPPQESMEAESAPSAGDVRTAMVEEGKAACELACEHIATCSAEERPSCVDDCQGELAGSSGAPAMRYAGCVRGLSCAQIEVSHEQNLGPVELCYLEAARMSR